MTIFDVNWPVDFELPKMVDRQCLENMFETHAR